MDDPRQPRDGGGRRARGAREADLLVEALSRRWIDAESVARWLAEGGADRGSLLDEAVARGLLSGDRAAALRAGRSPRPTPAAAYDAAVSDAAVYDDAACDDAPTRSIRGRRNDAAGAPQPDPRTTPSPATGAAPPPPVDGDAPTEVRDTDAYPLAGTAPVEGAPFILPRPLSLVPLPDEEPFVPVGPIASGRYELGPVVGRGGMGVVHVARDTALGRRVALKMLRASPRANPGHAEALAREAQTTGQLDHPGIVPVHELRAESDGSLFYTMKLVTGVSLAEVIRRLRARDPDTVRAHHLTRRLQVFQQICMALHYAHTRGVLHRDVKPANVLLGNYGEVLIVDWGIAQVIGVHQRLRDGSGLAAADDGRPRLVGTPHYMSPEQASGNLAGLDVRSDIYSLGVILYELVALTLPFDAADTGEYLARVRSGPLPPPSTRVRGRPPAPELERIIARATAFDRRGRYRDARALWEDVEAYIEGRQERDRRRQRAREAFVRGRTAAERYHELTVRREALADRIRTAEAAVDPWTPREHKQELARLTFQRENLDLLLARAFSDATLELQRSVADDPESDPPRRALGRLLHERFQAAEARRDVVAMTYFGDQIEQYGRTGPFDDRPGRVDVRTFPEGAEVSVLGVRDVEADPTDAPGRPLGRAPLAALALPPGIHVFVARMDGHRDERYPVFVRPGSHQSVLLAPAPWSTAVPMVGREGELAQLRALFESCVEHRRARFCLVVGELGSGRTRLQDAFADYIEARPDVVVFAWIHCLASRRGVPWNTIVELLRFRSGVLPGDGAAVVRERLRDLTRSAWEAGDGRLDDADRAEADAVADVLAGLPGLAGAVAPDDGLTAEERHARRAAALDAWLVRLGARLPIALILKETQWIDGTSRRFLESFVARHGGGATGAGVPLFILGSTSSTLEDGRLAGRNLPHADLRLRLPPLTRPAAAQLVTSLLKGRAHDDVVALVNERAQGNPYLAQELTHYLRERGHVRHEAGEWGFAEELFADLPPVAVSHFLAERVRSLPPPERAALECAAVVGRVFWAEALAWIGVADPKPLLAELVRRDLVHAVPHARYRGAAEFAFRLETLWKIAYAGVPGERRRALHRRAADWLASRGGASFAHRALLALHRDRAGEAAAAARLHAALARDAAAHAAWDEAVHHWDHALAHPLAAADRAAWRSARDEALSRRGS